MLNEPQGVHPQKLTAAPTPRTLQPPVHAHELPPRTRRRLAHGPEFPPLNPERQRKGRRYAM